MKRKIFKERNKVKERGWWLKEYRSILRMDEGDDELWIEVWNKVMEKDENYEGMMMRIEEVMG